MFTLFEPRTPQPNGLYRSFILNLHLWRGSRYRLLTHALPMDHLNSITGLWLNVEDLFDRVLELQPHDNLPKYAPYLAFSTRMADSFQRCCRVNLQYKDDQFCITSRSLSWGHWCRFFYGLRCVFGHGYAAARGTLNRVMDEELRRSIRTFCTAQPAARGGMQRRRHQFCNDMLVLLNIAENRHGNEQHKVDPRKISWAIVTWLPRLARALALSFCSAFAKEFPLSADKVFEGGHLVADAKNEINEYLSECAPDGEQDEDSCCSQ